MNRFCDKHQIQMKDLFTSCYCPRCDEEAANPFETAITVSSDGTMEAKGNFVNITWAGSHWNIVPAKAGKAAQQAVKPTPPPIDPSLHPILATLESDILWWRAGGGSVDSGRPVATGFGVVDLNVTNGMWEVDPSITILTSISLMELFLIGQTYTKAHYCLPLDDFAYKLKLTTTEALCLFAGFDNNGILNGIKTFREIDCHSIGTYLRTI